MSWLNLNQSLNTLKGQITNFASEVLSEGNVPDSDDAASKPEYLLKELEEKCVLQQAEIESLKKLNEELRTSLQSERLTGKNGVRDEESSWYWDPPPQANKPINEDIENQYKSQIRLLQDELSAVRERDAIDLRPDTEEELNRLREENRNLTKNLEELDNQHQLAMERLLSLKKELQKNFEVLKQEHEDLKNSNDEYVTEVKVLLEKIGERDREIESIRGIKSDYETLQHKYQNLERVHGMLRENAEKFQEENQELHEEVFKLQEQVTKLEHEIEISNKQTDLINMVPKENYESLLKEVNDLKSRRNSNEIHLDEVNIDDNAKSVIENLKRDINDLRHKLSQKETDSQRQFDEKTIKAEKIMLLYNKYVNFELPVDYVGEIPSSDDSIVLYKLESVFKTLNSFKKELDVLEHKLSEKKLNANHLQTQIDDLTTENEYLTTDLHHFETELNEMKKNNDFLISEIAALKNTSKLEPIIETHEDNLVKLETELADCNRINQTFESKLKTIEKELTEVCLEKTELQKSLSDLREKYTVMIAEMETFKNQSKAVEELEHTATTETTDKLNKATEEIDEFKRRLSAANAKNEQLSIDNHIIENDKVLLTKEVHDLKQLLEKKSSEQKELESQKFALERKLQNLENKLEETFTHKTELENNNIQLKDKISDLENKILSKNNITLIPEIEQLTTEKIHLSEKLDQTIKENSMLREDIDKLKNTNRDFEKQAEENLVLKNMNSGIQENITLLQSTVEKLESKIVDQDSLSNENINLRNENQNLKERKTQLEAELILTDEKIVNLEQEFDKLIIDLNEKDNIIENLNATIVQNNVNLTTLNQNVTDLQNNISIKNQEIERLNHSVAEITEKLEGKNRESTDIQQNLSRLHDEKYEINQKLSNISDELMAKISEIDTLKTLLRDQENVSLNYKSTIETKDKEIKELNQSIVELTEKLKSIDNTTHHNDEYAKLAQEKETIEKEVTEFRNLLATKEREVVELNTKSDQLEKVCIEFKTAIENSTAEKNELINLINLKHNESIQYHNEIQRLNQVLMEQTNEFKRIIVEKDDLLQNRSDSCSNCDSLRVTLKEKDEIIVTLNQSFTDFEKLKADLINANETVRQLTEKCDNLDKSLTIQLETVKHLTAENVQLSEKEQNSSRELERLRHHLLETEENYTQELMASEQKLTECQTRLHQVEERAKQTSTVYTSNSIRANQEVETLRNQIKLLEKQREDVEARLSDAEDARSRSEAALINLQVVLEQFQLDKERDVHASTEKIRNKMEELKRQNNGLQEEIGRLNIKLEESLAGLQAASRLGDQVETKTAQINDLKEQVRTLQMSVAAAEERYYNAISNQQDKVDKNLVKNLIINYVTTPGQKSVNRTQVLRVMSTVLDFNRQECERLGLLRAANAPEGLAAEFVKFLQNESQPPGAQGAAAGTTGGATGGAAGVAGGATGSLTSRSATPTSRKSSMLGPHPVLQPEPSHRRNPSAGSGNLLFQHMDPLETSSQLSAGSEPRASSSIAHLDTGVNQTRNTEGAILKHVLNSM